MGFDLFQCQDFLEQRGLPEMQLNNLVDNLNNPQYINVLKTYPMMVPQQQQPQMMMPQQYAGGVNPMMNMMGNQMLGQVNAAMQGQPVMMAAPAGQQINYNYNQN